MMANVLILALRRLPKADLDFKASLEQDPTYFSFMCLHADVYILHAGSQRGKSGCQTPGARVTGSYELSDMHEKETPRDRERTPVRAPGIVPMP